MAEKQEATERAYTSPQVNPYGRVDEEVASVAERDERRKKRMKCFAYLIAFIVFQTGVFLIFGLTIMKVRTPRYQNSTIEFFYQGTKVGEAFVPRARAKAGSTRRFYVTVDLSSAGVPRDVLANEFRTHAVIPLRSQARLRGKVEIMKIMKKNKSSNMNCSMEINISSRQLGNISCR
ncbi:hypothetical protein Salat_0902500 [Sesamum alatum]|uniref:Late embryogenesis abundant protein LEA-2 subgroup domain-containing protein n=1 Tax=Sesamum alatum TaxID=300844 RepID=A0AAE2CRD8_9LAMI|nr:hypothetical protein Salat_0902500 [Sesamum alatum]